MADQTLHLLHASMSVRDCAGRCYEHVVECDSSGSVHVCHHPQLALSSLYRVATPSHDQITRKIHVLNILQMSKVSG